jgi:hypothetical protein
MVFISLRGFVKPLLPSAGRMICPVFSGFAKYRQAWQAYARRLTSPGMLCAAG